jgi:hypothetical protein
MSASSCVTRCGAPARRAARSCRALASDVAGPLLTACAYCFPSLLLILSTATGGLATVKLLTVMTRSKSVSLMQNVGNSTIPAPFA